MRSLLVERDYAAVNDASLVVENELQDLMAACLAKAGFDYQPVDQSREAEAATVMQEILDEEVRFPVDLQEANGRGFGVVAAATRAIERGLDSPPHVGGVQENAAYLEALSDAAAEEYAYEKGKCAEMAIEDVDLDWAVYDLVAEVEAAAADRLAASPEYHQTTVDWTSCLRSEGFLADAGELDGPADVVAYVQESVLTALPEPDSPEDMRAALERSRAFETSIAVASLECGATSEMFSRLEAMRLAEIEAELERRGL